MYYNLCIKVYDVIKINMLSNSNSKISEAVLHLATHNLTQYLRQQLNQFKNYNFNDLKHLQTTILLKLLSEHKHPSQKLILIIYNYNKKLLLQSQTKLSKEEIQFLSRSSTKNYILMIIKRQIEHLLLAKNKKQQERIVKIQYDIVSNYLNLGEQKCKKQTQEGGIIRVGQNDMREANNGQMQDQGQLIKPQEKEQSFVSYRMIEEQQRKLILSQQEYPNIGDINVSFSLSNSYSLPNNCQQLNQARQVSIDTRHFDRSGQDNSSQIYCKQQQQETSQHEVILYQTQVNGHFIFGDCIQDIKHFQLIDDILLGHISWKQRQQGVRPADSMLSIDEIRNYIPRTLCDKLKSYINSLKK